MTSWSQIVCHNLVQYGAISGLLQEGQMALLGLKRIGDLYPSNSDIFLCFGELQSKFRLDKNIILISSTEKLCQSKSQ